MAQQIRGVNLGSIIQNVNSSNIKVKRYKQKKNISKETIKGVDWFYFLVPNENHMSLIEHVGPDDILSSFVVCMNIPSQQKTKPIRLFSAFNSYLNFINYIKDIPQEKWGFFEEILGDQPQKLYFDIDITTDNTPSNVDMDYFSKTLLDILIENILTIFSNRGYNLDLNRNVLLFSSNSTTKRSYHIVIDGYIVSHYKENAVLAKEILKDIPIPYRRCIDETMYSSKQQFRLLGSQKLGSGRPKIFVDKWYYKGQLIEYTFPESINQSEDINTLKFTTLFAKSCVTVTYDCEYLNIEVDEDEKIIPRQYTSNDDGDVEITEEIITAITNRIDKVALDIFKFDKVVGSLILLRRKKPANCSICNRVHENENAFLRIDKNGQVWFYCRRNEDSKNKVADLSDIVGNITTAHISSVMSNICKYSFSHTQSPVSSNYSTPVKNSIEDVSTNSEVVLSYEPPDTAMSP